MQLPSAIAAFAWAVGLLAALPAALPVWAEPPSNAAPAEEIKTLKERLSDKASDEQRVDNCRVPEAQRGAKARPDCPAEPATKSASTTSAR